MDILVSNHALERYRYRAAAYADASEQDVRQHFQFARRLEENESIPKKRGPDSLYFKDDYCGVYFVVRPLEKDKYLITTVLTDDMNDNPIQYKDNYQIKTQQPLTNHSKKSPSLSAQEFLECLQQYKNDETQIQASEPDIKSSLLELKSKLAAAQLEMCSINKTPYKTDGLKDRRTELRSLITILQTQYLNIKKTTALSM